MYVTYDFSRNIFMILILCMMQEILLISAKPTPDDDGLGLEDIAIDLDTIISYTDGSWKDKYNDSSFDGYDVKQGHNCDDAASQEGCHYTRIASIGSDAFGHQSNSKVVAGSGYEHEQQTIFGAEAEHKGKVQLGEANIRYKGEVVSSAKYDETYLGGSIGPKVVGFVQATGFGVGVGAGVEVGVAADAGYNSHDKNVALKATTPVGAYGVKVGCKNEVCFVGCFSLSIC